MARKKTAAPLYDPPDRVELSQWRPADRLRDYRKTFGSVEGQRVLYDILHELCGIGSNPTPAGDQPSRTLLDQNVGKQLVGYAILEVLTIPIQQVTETNRERFER